VQKLEDLVGVVVLEFLASPDDAVDEGLWCHLYESGPQLLQDLHLPIRIKVRKGALGNVKVGKVSYSKGKTM